MCFPVRFITSVKSMEEKSGVLQKASSIEVRHCSRYTSNMQPPSSFTITVFLLFDLHFVYLDKFFYVMIVVPSFTLRLHTSKSSNPHIPDDCDTHVHLKEYFQKSIKGRRRVKHAHLYFTPPKSTHFQKESML